MSYDSVVLVKQVPDTKAVTGKAMKDDGTVNRSALPAVFNPEDLNALEMALQVKETHGGSVTVITMGPPMATAALREALYRGADRAILVSDRRAAASDTLATSYILSCAVRKIGKHDLVFCGRQAIDGDTAQVGPQTAEKLGLTQVTYVQEIQALGEGRIRVRRNTDTGFQVVETSLPLLLTVVDTANEPRPPGARRIMRLKRAASRAELTMRAMKDNPGKDRDEVARIVDDSAAQLESDGLLIEEWNLDDIGADLQWCGRFGSPTWVNRIQSVVLAASETRDVPADKEGVAALVHELIEDHTIG